VQVAAPGGTDRGPGAPPLALLRSAVGVPGCGYDFEDGEGWDN